MQNVRVAQWMLLWLCCCLIGGGVSTAHAQAPGGSTKCTPQWSKRFKVRFENKSVDDVIKWLSQRTCYNFIVGKESQGKQISLIAERDVPLRELYRAFLAALVINDLAILQQGQFRRLISTRDARNQTIPTYVGKRFPHARRSEVVTYLLRPKFIDLNTISNIIRQLSTTSGLILPIHSSGVIILIDYAVNIHRLLKIVRALDIAEASGRDKMYLVQVENGQAQDMVQKLTAIFHIMDRARARTTRQSGTSIEEAHRISKILADERTNRVIVVCSEKAYLNAVALIRKLDLSLTEGGSVHVHRLKFAKAEEITQTLSQLTQGKSAAPRRVVRGRKAPAAKSASSTDLLSGEARISPDKGTNSLIIVASQRDYLNLLKVINRLDIRRKQVFVEVAILEVSVDKGRELGAAFHGGAPVNADPANPSYALFGTSLAGLNSLVLDPAALMGLAFGLRGPDIPGSTSLLGGTTGIPSFGVVLRAIQSNNDVDVISTPHILTTANEEALIQVGQNVPFIAGTSFTSAGLGVSFPVRNIQRQDVALTLKIKPQINAGSKVKLDVDLEITEIAEQNQELGPTTTKRKIKTVVRVKGNQTIVIGGLMRDKITLGVSKVPFLGDIPLLGALFRVKSKKVEKRNLLVFLTPHVILHPSDFQRIFKQKMEERQKFLKLFYDDKAKKNFTIVKLPTSRRGVMDMFIESADEMNRFNAAKRIPPPRPKPVLPPQPFKIQIPKAKTKSTQN